MAAPGKSPHEKTPIDTARRYLRDADSFVRSYAGGVKSQDFQRLFDRDAGDAYRVLARDQPTPEPKEPLRRALYRTRVFFLGLSYRLTPARRVLFLVCIVFAILGMLDWAPTLDGSRLLLEASPTWFVLSIVGLVFLLTLELVDQVRVRDELEVARELQNDLLPRETPELADYRIAHAYRTANEVGGDYYDFIEMSDGKMAIAVGDASGHGIAAGLLMAITNATLKLAIDLDPHPSAVLELLNRTLYRTGDKRAFVSLFYAVLDPERATLTYACGGHPYPLLWRADDPAGSIEELGTGSLPLGIRPTLRVGTDETSMAPGDRLLLFSDGLPEAVNEAGEDFGYERVAQLLRAGGTADAIQERISVELDRHLAGRSLDDDFSVVVLGRNAVVPAPPGGEEAARSGEVATTSPN